jgi:uncharacterized protein
MTPEEKRCAEAALYQRIDKAFRVGNLDALRAAVAEDPAVIPNGRLPVAIGSCLVYAIYHSPVAFIRTLLELGADTNAPADDGFPPLIAALSASQDAPGANARTDVDDVLRLLLAFGADPNQRGINDYTALHMAVAVRRLFAIQLLLDAGADPDLRTRIDECESPLEMALAAGVDDAAAILGRRGQPLRQRLRSGVTLLGEFPGTGNPVRRQQNYRVRLRLSLSDGQPVRWLGRWGAVEIPKLEDDGATLLTDIWLNRGSLINGLFYGIDGMRIGGTRRLEIASHMAYGERGVSGVVPPNATLMAEVTVLAELPAAP